MKTGLYKPFEILSAVIPLIGPLELIVPICSPWTIPPQAKKTGKIRRVKFQLVNYDIMMLAGFKEVTHLELEGDEGPITYR